MPLGTAADVLTRIWDDVTGRQQAPDPAWIYGLAALALLIVASRVTWPHARHLVTMAHEGSHGLAAALTGRRQRGITLHADTSGRARSHGAASGLGLIVTTAAGYTGPALLGLAAALLLAGEHAMAALWLAVVLLALLLQIRNAWGLLVVLGSGAALGSISWWASDEVQSLVAYAGAWFLLIAAPRPVFELWGRHRRGQRGSDADVLATLTPLPAMCWIAGFLLVTVGALVAGGWLLLG
ncbi:MAG: M50 family metallopeptidase [Solirubrobacteraceae bacterium]|nr:M50 family metallopeptidase [Solirubrobacteraceae bacterium]